MTIPETLTNILGQWKLYAIITGAALLVATGIYLKGHSDGVDQTDNKWKAAIANSKPVEVHRDTILIAQKPDSGKFRAEIATVKQTYQARVDKILSDANQVGNQLSSALDSLTETNRQLETLLRSSLAARLIKLKTPEIGELILEYFPADSSANIYRHIPPPERVVTIYTEKLVLEPRSTFETVGYLVLGTGVGVLAAVLTHIK